MRKRSFRRLFSHALLLSLILLFALALSPSGYTALAESTAAPAGGSWAHINQPLNRPEDWTRIVEASPFVLGDPVQTGEINGTALYEVPYGAYPSIDGSTVAVPMALEFARQHLNLPEEDLLSFTFFSTTHAAYEHLILRQPNAAPLLPSFDAAMEANHPVDLILATAPSAEEQALADASGVTLRREPVCYDAFVFITRADNPVENLTVEQIRAIYSGKTTNWSAVGGPDLEIAAYQREANSGSQTAMESLVMQGQPLDGAKPFYVTEGMGDLVRRVGDYQNTAQSLGYTYLYYIDTLYRSGDIKILSVDGIAPTPENIRTGVYPFTAQYYAVIREGEPTDFLDWILSAEGQRSVEQAGYLPIQ